MKTLNSMRSYLSNRFLCLVIAFLISMISYAQQNSNMENWLKMITKKHKIQYDSYTEVHKNYFVIGEKKIIEGIETFKNVTILIKEKDYYFILRSENATYDPKKEFLKMDDCSYEKYKNDSQSLIPESKYTHRSFTHDFKRNRVGVGPIKKDSKN